MNRLLTNKAEIISPATLDEMELPEPKEKIIIKETRGRKKRTIQGTVVDIYDTFISVKLDGRKCKESFLKVDFLTGYLKIV
jgi:uncharacterized protein Veg